MKEPVHFKIKGRGELNLRRKDAGRREIDGEGWEILGQGERGVV